MKVLLVSTNQLRPTRYVPWEPVEPLGAAYVAAAVLRAGHGVGLLDLCFSAHPEKHLDEALERESPDVIGISFRNIEMTAYFNDVSFLETLTTIVSVCRERAGASVVLGGSGFSIMPEEILRLTGAELGIIGEGEWSFPELLSRIEKGAEYDGIPGLVRLRDGSASRALPDRGHELRGNVFPARGLIDHAGYARMGGVVNVQTKRGCPMGCIYCTYPIIEGSEPRCRPTSEVLDELVEISQRFGIERAYMVDSQFNNPPDRAKELCMALASMRERVKLSWSCMINPAGVDEELAFLMRLAGCRYVDLGADSGSETMLGMLGKGFTKDDVARAASLFGRSRISFGTWILLGGPGESEATIRETLQFLSANNVSDVLFSVGLRVYPGTPLERIARDEGRLEGRTDLIEPAYYLSMEAQRIVSIVEPHLGAHQGWRIAARRRPDG